MLEFNNIDIDITKLFIHRISHYTNLPKNHSNSNNKTVNILDKIDVRNIMNIKETRSFHLIETVDNIPKDIFNIICDNIITEITAPKKIVMTTFRDKLYDILTYNLDINDCLWYIITYFIENNNTTMHLKNKDISDILIKTYSFFKFFNNNYRPIFHLESIMYYIINKIHNLE
jgi:hypothetical protein